jgi:hypothetical protein
VRSSFRSVLVTTVCLVASAAVGGAADWQQLAQQYVDGRANPAVVTVKPDAPTVSELKLQVKQSALEIVGVKVVLADGDSFDVPLKVWLAAGRETTSIDVPGGPKAVQKVEVSYQGYSSDGRLALIRLFGAS